MDQMDLNILDRQAVGAEFRYNDMTKSAFLTVDYDVHFDKLEPPSSPAPGRCPTNRSSGPASTTGWLRI